MHIVRDCAWNNNYSGQKEAMLCIVKCLKEDRKLVFQYVQQQFQGLTEVAGKHLDLCTGAIHPWSERIT